VVFAEKFYSSAKLGGVATRMNLNQIHSESPEAWFAIKRLFTATGREIDHDKYGFFLIVTEGAAILPGGLLR
jgi:hypothetical protein